MCDQDVRAFFLTAPSGILA